MLDKNAQKKRLRIKTTVYPLSVYAYTRAMKLFFTGICSNCETTVLTFLKSRVRDGPLFW